MKPAGLKTTEPRNSTDHRSGLSLSVARGNFYQVWWAPDAFALIRRKEETPELIRKESRSEDPAKPRILNRQLSMDSGTLLRDGPIIVRRTKPPGVALPPHPDILQVHRRLVLKLVSPTERFFKTAHPVDGVLRLLCRGSRPDDTAYSDANRTPLRSEVGQRSDSKRTVFLQSPHDP